MAKVQIEIDDEVLSQFMEQEISWHHDQMKRDLKERKAGGNNAIFEHDRKADIKAMKKFIKSSRVVGEYFGVDFKK